MNNLRFVSSLLLLVAAPLTGCASSSTEDTFAAANQRLAGEGPGMDQNWLFCTSTDVYEATVGLYLWGQDDQHFTLRILSSPEVPDLPVQRQRTSLGVGFYAYHVTGPVLEVKIGGPITPMLDATFTRPADAKGERTPFAMQCAGPGAFM